MEKGGANPIAEIDDTFREWLEYKNSKGSQKLIYTEKGLESLIKQIEKKLKETSKEYVEEVIHNSIAQGWKGIIWDSVKYTKNETSDIESAIAFLNKYPRKGANNG